MAKEFNSVKWISGLAKTDYSNLQDKKIMDETIEKSIQELLNNLRDHIELLVYSNPSENGRGLDAYVRTDIRIVTKGEI